MKNQLYRVGDRFMTLVEANRHRIVVEQVGKCIACGREIRAARAITSTTRFQNIPLPQVCRPCSDARTKPAHAAVRT